MQLVEDLKDTTLLFTNEEWSQEEQRKLNESEHETIFTCSVCNLAPTYQKYVESDTPPSISRRFSIFCPKCTAHPMRMFTIVGMISYWNRIRH
jgi:uncharacterized CHY-type Zn-finger protein